MCLSHYKVAFFLHPRYTDSGLVSYHFGHPHFFCMKNLCYPLKDVSGFQGKASCSQITAMGNTWAASPTAHTPCHQQQSALQGMEKEEAQSGWWHCHWAGSSLRWLVRCMAVFRRHIREWLWNTCHSEPAFTKSDITLVNLMPVGINGPGMQLCVLQQLPWSHNTATRCLLPKITEALVTNTVVHKALE